MTQMRRINLALQGGGAHGAFTWGVLDRILDDESLEVAAISGASAGALNGAAFKSGWVRGGREGARETLDWLWEQVGLVDDLRLPAWMTGFLPDPGAVSEAMDWSPMYLWADTMTRMISPYSYGPFYQNPLEPVVRQFAYDDICQDAGPQLFIGATNVHSGKIRVFSGDEISTDCLLASACLPTLFQAVEIDGAHYWDGGYCGNPALFPLFAPDLPGDIVVVNINPLERPDVPRSPQDILNRINEISFNTSLLRELRAIAFVQKLLDGGDLSNGAMKRVFVHLVADDPLMRDLSVATKMVPTSRMLLRLKEAGRRAADRFLDGCSDNIGQRNSVDLAEMYG